MIERFDAGLECSPTSNNSPQVVEYLKKAGVRDYDYRTIRYDGHWRLVQGWKTLGYLRGDAARDQDLARPARGRSGAALRPGHRPRPDHPVRARIAHGERPAARRSSTASTSPADKITRFAAMELTTCWGITIVAHHMASGRGAPKGFATPERFVDTSWVLAEVERRLATVAR